MYRGDTKELLARYDIGSQKLWILGRNEQFAHILSMHDSISRQHTALCYNSKAKSFYVVDLKSAHGTQVDGKKIEPWVPVPGM